MEYNSLYDLIRYLQYGTKLHIGVLFFGDYGNKKCILPNSHKIHSGKICDVFKSSDNGFKRCSKCRNLAIKKALLTKKTFSGYCINGIFEYIRPIIINNEVASIIFIGNILDKNSKRLARKLHDKEYLLETLENKFTAKDCETVGSLLEVYIKTLLKNVPPEEDALNPLIENIKSYINENIEFNVTLSHISELFHYNQQYLGRLFKKETGMNFNEYINLEKLKNAKYILEQTNLKVLDVSYRVGFNNVTYFNRIFKKHFGLSPTEYRKHN